MCELKQVVLVKLVLKVYIISECFSSIIKLAQDALKELVEFNSCKYDSLVATHLIVSFRTNLLRGFCAINTFEVGQVYFIC